VQNAIQTEVLPGLPYIASPCISICVFFNLTVFYLVFSCMIIYL
jgi:hypothetical protein